MLLSLFFFGSTFCAVIPFERCLPTDMACLIRDGQKIISIMIPGMPEYDIESLDPLTMDYVEFDSSGLLFTLSNATLKGIKKNIIDEYNWDLQKKVLSFIFHTDITLKGKYTAKGKVLTIPITGDGDIKIKLKNMECKVKLDFEIVKKDNKDYVKLTKYEYDFDVKDNANYQLTNLFNGNKELSDAALKFGNANWKQLASMFGRPVINVVAMKLVKSYNKFFQHQPLDTFLKYDAV